MTINWRAIKTISGSQAHGFEELCTQLARVECPASARFVRKGAPDAGVECYAMFPDGSEWGWQAKFFDIIGDAQWSQLDDSVKTALDKHQHLIRYYICVPLDLPDARVDGRRSAQDRWNEHVQKWGRWADAKGLELQFIYWGSSELIERLSRPEQLGRLRFWFDAIGFDQQWFSQRLTESIESAGPRFTPEIHVELDIAQEFDAFGRTERFFDGLKQYARNIRQQLSHLRYEIHQSTETVLEPTYGTFQSTIEILLNQLGELHVQPAGNLPFSEMLDTISTADAQLRALEQLVTDRENECSAQSPTPSASHSSLADHKNPFEHMRRQTWALERELAEARDALNHGVRVANGDLMILSGRAGTGKTHLLCDVAQNRIQEGRPTVLLMGQRFMSQSDPWTQVLQLCDLRGFSAEEFVGALEAAAQAANCRALVMLDALNEGAGRSIWPSHLAAFIAQLRRSPWIGIVLAIRSSFEEIVIPDAIRRQAFRKEHFGFAEHEFNATRIFFAHYGLELPSTPLLAPEFSNPLFLKTLCQSLYAKGERRLPRGFHGISAIFEAYLDAVNERLAHTLGFDRRHKFAHKALTAFAQRLSTSDNHWLSWEDAETLVNAFLPGRDLDRSLYFGLVVEGILVEEGAPPFGASGNEVVFIAYERFADHLIAKILLDIHLDLMNPEAAFLPEGGLAFLADNRRYTAPGILEALCIQVPERIGRELPSIAPGIAERHSIGDAFRQSIIWRRPDAISEETRQQMQRFTQNQYQLGETLDALLTVTTLPEHPLNANYLDHRLRRDSMPQRDSWWSIYLHRAWNRQGAVDRLVEWAWSITSEQVLDNDSVELCAVSLAWMLSTSNRFLRDRATKALVSLLTGRYEVAEQFIERFQDVDDLYIRERIYAVAYGICMRSHDGAATGRLAQLVYEQIFSTGEPPPHILLRDYARGVIERAIYLQAEIQVDETLICPPYKSQWPTIPTEDEIQCLFPKDEVASWDGGDTTWSRNRIRWSVMDDDFAWYVIGTNSGQNEWLSLRIEESKWQSPDERLAELLTSFSAEESAAWHEYDSARSRVRELSWRQLASSIRLTVYTGTDGVSSDALASEDTFDLQLAEASQAQIGKFEILRLTLAPEKFQQLETLLVAIDTREGNEPPLFDLSLVQRYVAWRVLDLGWTTERFGEFDRFDIGLSSREASKPERIGKKYQWIAYHEITALIADHFQYRDNKLAESYDGTWQNRFRDIDPSSTLRNTPGGTSWHSHSPAWWAEARYQGWNSPKDPAEWTTDHADLPVVADLLRIVDPDGGFHWLNLCGYFHWEQPTPADKEGTETERRDLWYMCTGYLIRLADVVAFIEWSQTVDFWGRWMPEPAHLSDIYMGEIGWSPAFRYFQHPYFGDDGWTIPAQECPVQIRVAASEYLCESGGFDCSIDDTYKLRIPSIDLLEGLGLKWSGQGADYVNSDGQVSVFDPTAHLAGPDALLVREDALQKHLLGNGLTICWVVLGEKRVLGPGINSSYFSSSQITGAYVLKDTSVDGFLQYSEQSRSVDTES